MSNECRTFINLCNKSSLLFASVLLTGCASLLPQAEQNTESPWPSYTAGADMFAKIKPGSTRLADLRNLKIVPVETPNLNILAYTDLLRRLTGSTAIDPGQWDANLRTCLNDHPHCFGYQIKQREVKRKRHGNFLLDFLNFDRKVEITGWEFDAVLVIHKDTVVYKLWTGNPSIRENEREQNPLGPLQGLGSSLINR